MGKITVISVLFKLTEQSQGKADLVVDNAEPITGVISAIIPYVFPVHSNLSCGLDRGLSVCADYQSPFTFTGDIESVKVSVGEQRPIDHAKVLRAVLAEQ